MWVLLVDAEEVPWRFGLRSDSGMMMGLFGSSWFSCKYQLSWRMVRMPTRC